MICTIITTGAELLLKGKNEYEHPYRSIKEQLHEIIWQLFCTGYHEFYVNCEYGVPLWAAEFICALKMYNPITLHIAVPNEEQTVLWCEEWRDRYYAVHEKADSIAFVHIKYHDNCYRNADKMMIDESDMVLIFGTPSDTFYVEQYANIYNKRIRYFNIEI